MLSLKYKNIVKKALYENDYNEQVARMNISTIQSVYDTLKNINVDNKIYEREDKGVKIFYTLQKNTDNNIKLSAIDRAKVIMTDKVKNYSNHKKSQLYNLKGIGIEKINDTYHLSEVKDKLWLIVWDETENISDLYQIPEIKRFFNHGCHMFEEVETNLLKIYNEYRKILYPSEQNTDDELGMNYNKEESKINPPEQIDNVDRIPNENKEIAFVTKGWKAPKEFMFDPQHIIGDNKFRTRNGVYLKVSKNLQEFYKKEDISTETSFWKKRIKTKDEKTGETKIISEPMMPTDTIPPQFIAAHCLEDLVKNASELKKPTSTLTIDKKYEPQSSVKHVTGMKMPDTLTFNESEQDYAKELVKLLDVKPAEIISPLIVLGLNDEIFPDDKNKTKNTLLKVFGVDENAFHNGLISYPAASEELVDSYCAIQNDKKYSLLGVSTKGGYDGRGAQASTISLFRMIYKDPQSIPSRLSKKFNLNINYNNEKELLSSVYELLSDYGKDLFDNGIKNNKNSSAKDCQVALTMLTIFGGSMVKEHIGIIDKLNKNNIFGLNNTNISLSDFCHYINNNYKITDCIMNILDSQKYKFAQLNCTPHLKENIFWFNYKIQYPAHFEGTVTFEPRGKGIGFHILGKIA